MNKTITRFRWGVQLAVLALVTVMGILHQTMGGGFEGSPTVHAICPFGALESLFNLLTGKSYIAKTYYSNTVLALGSGLLVFFAGRFFCGWICALGTMQDIPAFFGKKKLLVPEKLDKYLRWIKYVVLVAIIYFTWKTSTLVINPYDPFAAYSHISAGWGELWGEYSIGFSILVTMIFLSFFYVRLFCRYICPLGAVYSILGKFSFLKINRDKETCVNCKKCTKVCPAAIDVAKADKVKPVDCYSCMKCVATCPTKTNSLSTNLSSPVPTVKLAGAALGVFVGIILATKALGFFETMPNSLDKILKNNPANIRGWMTYEQVIQEFKLEEKEVYEKLGFTEEELPLSTPIKMSGEAYAKKNLEFDDGMIKGIVAEMVGVTPEKAVTGEATFTFSGKLTLNEIWTGVGMSPEELVKKLGLPKDIPLDKSVKD
ncbi:MAG: 4Fe-4S binding protein, partial [Fusobacteriaceae bacterium]